MAEVDEEEELVLGVVSRKMSPVFRKRCARTSAL